MASIAFGYHTRADEVPAICTTVQSLPTLWNAACNIAPPRRKVIRVGILARDSDLRVRKDEADLEEAGEMSGFRCMFRKGRRTFVTHGSGRFRIREDGEEIVSISRVQTCISRGSVR